MEPKRCHGCSREIGKGPGFFRADGRYFCAECLAAENRRHTPSPPPRPAPDLSRLPPVPPVPGPGGAVPAAKAPAAPTSGSYAGAVITDPPGGYVTLNSVLISLVCGLLAFAFTDHVLLGLLGVMVPLGLHWLAMHFSAD